MASTPLRQIGINLATKVVWRSGQTIVFDVKRMGNSHGNAPESAPFFFFTGMLWDAFGGVLPTHINWDFFRNGFPPLLTKPGPPDFKMPIESAGVLCHWGSYETHDTQGGGGVGASATDYTPGEWVRNLAFFNVGALKKRPPYLNNPNPTIQFGVHIDPVIKVDDPGSGPQTVYYIWGVPSGFGTALPALAGDPVFTGPSGPPPYYAAPFEVADIGTPNPITTPYYQAIHWRLSTYALPPGTPLIPIAYPTPLQSEAQVQSIINWAASIGILGGGTGFRWNSLTIGTGTIPPGTNPPITQPEKHIEFTVKLYSGMGPFPYTETNVPTWPLPPNPQAPKVIKEFSFTWGGTAPQPGRNYQIKLSAANGLQVTQV